MPIEINKWKLGKLILSFKKKAYAGDGVYRTTKHRTKRFDAQKDDWFFSDEYDGNACFAGEERLSCFLSEKNSTDRKITGVWHQVYSGRVLNKIVPKETIFDFLRKPLQKPSALAPFRGPTGLFRDKEFPGFTYHNELISGKYIDHAAGVEKIEFNEREVYQCFWCGGILLQDLGDIILVQ